MEIFNQNLKKEGLRVRVANGGEDEIWGKVQ